MERGANDWLCTSLQYKSCTAVLSQKSNPQKIPLLGSYMYMLYYNTCTLYKQKHAVQYGIGCDQHEKRVDERILESPEI
eukprot:COSAG05_NODE_1358_length_5103_cov_18.985811_7_plen_79_part_00